jgi:predicted AlkP superfamily pyrophosphatase or phosphodiesterase
MTNKQHVIVISYDAFSKDNWALAKQQPNLASLIQSGASTTNVVSVYPTLTYVIHSTYVTGVYPNKHGVHHNCLFQPFIAENDQDWHWYRQNIKGTTIYEVAKQQGLTTAGLLWPVSGKSNMDYFIPEMKAVRGENQALKILKNGRKLFTLQMELKYGKIRKGIEQPHLDNFTTQMAVDTIKTKKPNLLLMHLIDLDDQKHIHGTKGEHIKQTIVRMDNRIGDIVNATKVAGTFEQTTFIVVGDHSQLDVQYKVYLNYLFAQEGLIYEVDGKMHWRAYVQGAGGSAFLHVQQNDTIAEQKALEILQKAFASHQFGIEQIYDRTKLDELNVEQKYKYMIEAKIGYCFEDEHLIGPVIDLHAQGRKYATHGYTPFKENYTSNLIISGPTTKKGETIQKAHVVDIAPTIAHLLKLPFSCDGNPLLDAFE